MSHATATWVLLPDVESAGATLDRQTSTLATGVDWALDLSTGDLIFPLRYTTGLEAVAQGLFIRLQCIRGEWMLDLDDGMPYYVRDGVPKSQAIIGQHYSKIRVLSAFREAIEATPGVDRILALDSSFDTQTRTLTVSFKVQTSFGQVVATGLEF